MAFHSRSQRLSACLLICFSFMIRADGSRKLYIAYLGDKKHDDPSLVAASHHEMLSTILGSKEEAIDSVAYSYKHGFSGFAAMLTEDQAENLAELPEVISVTPNQKHELLTTRSWDFLGLNYQRPSELLTNAAVLAAMDDAIHDGVDILSLSLAVDEDSFGALHAIQNGITVVYAGGNSGPRSQVLFNTAPWVITVAASKIDRSFPTTITA